MILPLEPIHRCRLLLRLQLVQVDFLLAQCPAAKWYHHRCQCLELELAALVGCRYRVLLLPVALSHRQCTPAAVHRLDRHLHRP
jgi:hypothetical protein